MTQRASLELKPPDSPLLAPALILTWGAVMELPSDPDETFAAGTGFLVDADHMVTAAHIGDMNRSDMARAGFRARGSNLPYRMHALDPRTNMSWRLVQETPVGTTDFAIYQIIPEDRVSVTEWRAWQFSFLMSYPVLRLTELSEGEVLEVRAFQNVEAFRQSDSGLGRRVEFVTGQGVVARGSFTLTKREGAAARPEMVGFSATGLNSGAPILDSKDRLVGLVSSSLEGGAAVEPYTAISLFSDWKFAKRSAVRTGPFTGIDVPDAPPHPVLKHLGVATDRLSLKLSND